MQVAALFDGLLIAGRLSCLGRLSNKGGGLKDEGRLGRWRLEEEEEERGGENTGRIKNPLYEPNTTSEVGKMKQ